MWEAITSIVTSKNMYQLLIFFVLLVWSVALLAKTGIFYFHNGFLSIGDGERERELIRRQQEWAYNYIMALENEIKPDTQDDSFGHYFRVAILEKVYDKVVEMIVFNHISERVEYVENKKALFKKRLRKEQRLKGAPVRPLGSPSASSRSCTSASMPWPEDRPSDRMATGLKIGSLT